jgi:hypothetical protein
MNWQPMTNPDATAAPVERESAPRPWAQMVFWSLFGLNFVFLLLGIFTNGEEFWPGARGFARGDLGLSLSESFFALAVIATVVLTALTLHPACRARDYSKAATLCICFTLFFFVGAK